MRIMKIVRKEKAFRDRKVLLWFNLSLGVLPIDNNVPPFSPPFFRKQLSLHIWYATGIFLQQIANLGTICPWFLSIFPFMLIHWDMYKYLLEVFMGCWKLCPGFHAQSSLTQLELRDIHNKWFIMSDYLWRFC